MKLSEVVEPATKSIAILSALSLILSIIYDWGYFFALGLSFVEIPTSISDHIRSALVWLPSTIIVVFIVFTHEYINQRIERGLSEEEIINSAKNPEKLSKFRAGPGVLFRIFAPIVVCGYFLIGDFYRYILPIALIATWTMFSEWLTNAPLIKLRRNKNTMLLFQVLPMIFFFFFFMGYNESSKLALEQKAHFSIKTINKEEQININVLRYFDFGALIIKPENKNISILPWNQITTIESLFPYEEYTGIVGKWRKFKKASNN